MATLTLEFYSMHILSKHTDKHQMLHVYKPDMNLILTKILFYYTTNNKVCHVHI